MNNSNLSNEEFEFLKNLISIESTGSDTVDDPKYGTLPYGLLPYSALKFFLDDASASGASRE